MRKFILAALIFIFLFSDRAGAVPAPVSSSNLSGSIAVTNTFQSVQGVNNSRIGCTVQNNDTNNMWVYFGTCANATKNSSAVLAPGQSLNCITASLYVLKDNICITGTSSGVFFANFQ